MHRYCVVFVFCFSLFCGAIARAQWSPEETAKRNRHGELQNLLTAGVADPAQEAVLVAEFKELNTWLCDSEREQLIAGAQAWAAGVPKVFGNNGNSAGDEINLYVDTPRNLIPAEWPDDLKAAVPDGITCHVIVNGNLPPRTDGVDNTPAPGVMFGESFYAATGARTGLMLRLEPNSRGEFGSKATVGVNLDPRPGRVKLVWVTGSLGKVEQEGVTPYYRLKMASASETLKFASRPTPRR